MNGRDPLGPFLLPLLWECPFQIYLCRYPLKSSLKSKYASSFNTDCFSHFSHFSHLLLYQQYELMPLVRLPLPGDFMVILILDIQSQLSIKFTSYTTNRNDFNRTGVEDASLSPDLLVY